MFSYLCVLLQDFGLWEPWRTKSSIRTLKCPDLLCFSSLSQNYTGYADVVLVPPCRTHGHGYRCVALLV
jgi:hypothetical protein